MQFEPKPFEGSDGPPLEALRVWQGQNAWVHTHRDRYDEGTVGEVIGVLNDELVLRDKHGDLVGIPITSITEMQVRRN